jgi:integrase
MASVSKCSDRDGWVIQFRDHLQQKRKLWVPGSSKDAKREAETIRFYIDDLVRTKKANMNPGPDAARWVLELEGRYRERMVSWGLADPVSPKLTTDEGRLLGAFLTSYIDGRSDVKAVTRVNYGQTRRLLVEYFGEKKPLKAITKADAERWRRWLMARVVKAATETTPAETMAVASVSKHGKRAKTMLSEAVKDRLLPESPFEDMKGGDESNSLRHSFIDQATAAKVIAACPDADWRVIFGLARFAGMRCPSEVLGLKWTDVLWDTGRLRIDSPKTGLRFCPIFPELLPILLSAAELAPKGAVYCVGRYRSGETNLRTQLLRILGRAGVAPWPKLFVNLRSTRRTELQESFPDHVVNNWLGHSGKVAEKHYLQVTEDHWGRAIEDGQICGSACGSISGHQETPTTTLKTKKPSVLLGSDGCCGAIETLQNDPDGNRTRVTAVKGRCPRPLDDGALVCL